MEQFEERLIAEQEELKEWPANLRGLNIIPLW